MDISHLKTVEEMEKFLQQHRKESIKPQAESKKELYRWINDLLLKIKYRRLTKKEKGIVKKFLKKTTNYSKTQIKRLISKHRQGKLKWICWQKKSSPTFYTRADIELLHHVDEAHRLSGEATKKILIREFEVYGKQEYRRLKNMSVSYIYNRRKSKLYLSFGRVFDKTKPTVSSIGIRTKPRPNGQPGYLRIDTVHQGDQGNKKSLYHINIVDEVTQIEFVFQVKAISEKYMREVLEKLYQACPFKIINFHSDNGSEYINKYVAAWLNKLHIKQTKSRPRRHNDNGLVETKNGSIIRKQFSYFFIPATDYNVKIMNQFCINRLNPYLNFHRPCGFPTTIIDKKGKQKKFYKQEDYMTPYEKLKSLPNAKQYLKKGITFKDLDKFANERSDTEFAIEMNETKKKMLLKLKLN